MHDVVDKVPFLDLSEEFSVLQAEWLESIRATGSQGSFVLGPNVAAFEKEVAAYVGSQYAIGVANGTDALVLSLRALGIGPGDEVITSPYTFFASPESISIVGAIPVFADILPDSFNLDPDSVRARLTDKTRAIMPVHIFGNPADMDAIMAIANEHHLKVVEDAAQAFGASVGDAKVGSIGTTGCFSFYPTKVLGGYGDGGVITTNDAALVDSIRKTRNHGAVKPFVHDEIGTNSRLDELQASLLRIKLRDIEKAIAGRRKVAETYTAALADTAVTPPPSHGGHAFNLYTIRTPRRDAVRQHLNDHNVATSLCYPQPLHLQPVYSGLGYQVGDLPISEQASTEALSLPIYPTMPESHILRVYNLIKEIL